MWRRLCAAPWWVQAVVVGLPVGVLAGVIVDFGLVEDLIAGAGSQLYVAISEPAWWNAATALTFVLLTASYHHQHRRLLEQAALLRAG